MDFKDLIEHLDYYRLDEDFKASNIVFPVHYEGNFYIIKKPRNIVTRNIIRLYYSLQQDHLLGSSIRSLENEAESLAMLDGLHTPKLYHFDKKKTVIVREFIPGVSLEELYDHGDIECTLQRALENLIEIHSKDVTLGEGHAKNIFLGDNSKVYWMDLERREQFDDVNTAKANDLVTFMYSTYHVTKDEDASLSLSEQIYDYSKSAGLIGHIKGLLPRDGPLKLWIKNRLPQRLDKRLKMFFEL